MTRTSVTKARLDDRASDEGEEEVETESEDRQRREDSVAKKPVKYEDPSDEDRDRSGR